MLNLLFQENEYLSLYKLGKNSIWRYLLAGFVMMIFAFVLAVLPFAGLGAIVEMDGNPNTFFNPENTVNPFVCPTWMFITAVGLSFLIIALGVMTVVKFIHIRTIRTVFTSNISFKFGRVIEAAAVWIGLLSIATIVQYFMMPDNFEFSFNGELFWLSALSCLIFIPIQAGTEELVFRGYLQQSFAALINIAIFPLLISALLFGAAHFWNPELDWSNLSYETYLVAASYILIGLFAGVLTIRDRSLELPIGMHAGNNLFLSILCGYGGSALTTETVFKIKEMSPVIDFISLLLLATLFYLYWFGLRNRR